MENNVKFCTKCGAKQDKEAKFCAACGNAFKMKETEAEKPSVEPVKAIPTSAAPAPVNIQSAQKTKTGPGAQQRQADYTAIIKSNLNYYQTRFKQLDETGKNKMNWASFFLGFFHAGYRNMIGEWLKSMKISLIMVGVSLLLAVIAYLGVSALSVISVMLLGLSEVVLAIQQILFAVRFNKLYKTHVETKLRKGNNSPDPSIGRGIGASLLYGIVTGIVIVLMVAGLFSSLMSGGSDYDYDYDYNYGYDYGYNYDYDFSDDYGYDDPAADEYQFSEPVFEPEPAQSFEPDAGNPAEIYRETAAVPQTAAANIADESNVGNTDEDYSIQYGVKADGYYIEEHINAALNDPDGYLIPDIDQKYISADDYDWLDKETLRLAINEVYARHGRKYETEDLNEYFSSKNWYTPLYSANEFDDSVFNGYEKENIKTLAAIRDSFN